MPPSRSRSPADGARRSTVRFTGGTATVECRADGTAYLLSWSPADGYHIDDDVSRGPAAEVRLEAEPSDDDAAEDVTYAVTCTGGTPHPRALPDAD
ncbi:hypothetical protein [Streptomyces sp. G45]|uniref:hypothetical protein n=1 Tax=Streptomyces sp. G45 TaxID=3406627 RepID=UPI003C13D4A4